MINLLNWQNSASGSILHQTGLLRAWREMGYDVVMLTPCSLDWTNVPADIVQHVRPSTRVEKWGLPRSFGTLMQLFQLIGERWRYGRGVVFTRANSLTALLVAVGRVIGMQVIVDHNAWMERERIQRRGNQLIARLERTSQVFSAKWANSSRCVTAGLTEELVRAGTARRKLVTIGNGCDIVAIRPVDKIQACRVFGLSADRRYIGFIGNIVPWHGLDIAIEALPRIVDTHSNLDLVVFGDGPQRLELQKKADAIGMGHRVIFAGPVDTVKAAAAIGCFDIAIAPLSAKRDTAFGYSAIKIRDYAAAGRPVLTGHLPDSIDYVNQGWLFTHRPDDPDDFARKALKLLSPDVDLAAACKMARQAAEGQFAWPIIAQRIMTECTSG